MGMINQPSNQIKFTNVSLVRLKKGKKRFELACYKNKLLEYRSGTETDLDNVLQVPTIFLSVSKAQTAPAAEITKAFGSTATKDEIIQEILRKGEVQVGDKERKEILERVEKEVLEMVSSRLVDPVSKRVYTTGMISKALDQLSSASGQLQQQQKEQKEKAKAAEGSTEEEEQSAATHRKPLWTGVVQNKSAKLQALDAMKALIAWQPIPVMRSRMRLRITCPTSLLKYSVKAPSSSSSSNAQQPPSKSKGGNKKGKKKGGDDDEDAGAPPAGGTAGTVKDRILSFIEEIESQETVGSDEWEVVGFAEPGAFKGVSEFVGGETKGRGRVEVLDMSVTHEE